MFNMTIINKAVFEREFCYAVIYLFYSYNVDAILFVTLETSKAEPLQRK